MNKIIVILGPTAVGKTKMSVELAKKLNGEIINADSTQVFKELDIATAKITEEEKENIVHHLFDIKDITSSYTVYDYQKDCRKCIDDIISRGKTPILVGGTGLYIKAALYNYEFKEENNKSDYSMYSNDELYAKLLDIDKNTQIHKNNRKRIERALDCYNNTGSIIGDSKSDKLLYDTLFIGLTTKRDILYDRINRRVDVMVDNGLLDEAKKIYESNIRTKAITTPIGYKELFPYYENKEDLNTCLDKIKQNSRRYAKRQYTFFNHQLDVKWFDVNFDNFNETIDNVYEYIKKETN
ncbi:MAG TPA: tRNA (adenosine(37)-N6)-dimethylallyltransferase MiaA [Bacilli bacterium]|nr:tRNA (adenosine(37)-N6)-dimethylallyltransferase MiaA [Bacilli bacterium]